MGTKDKKKNERPSLDTLSQDEKTRLDTYVQEYTHFLAGARTAHETVDQLVARAESKGFVHYDQSKTTTNDGATGIIFTDDDTTNVALVKLGSNHLLDGINFLGAHVDAPCLTGKMHPIIEAPEGVTLDAMPYGGIFNYHYIDVNVNVIGRVVKEGKTIEYEFPALIPDVTIHIGRKIRKGDVQTAVPAESLDVFTGYRTKDDFLAFLKTHGLDERDFARGSLHIVPAQKPYVLPGGEMIAGYGHDDRVCCFAEAEALFDATPQYATMVLAVDREEIGSTGLSGATGVFMERVVDQLMRLSGFTLSSITDALHRHVYQKSIMLSADVDIAYDSLGASQSDKQNAAQYGKGLVLVRHNGGGGQGSGNYASSGLMDKLMCLFDENNVVHQITALPSKVGAGGGGTIAKFFAQRGIPTVDAGVPVGNMHGTTPLCHTGDVYQMYKGFKAFIERD